MTKLHLVPSDPPINDADLDGLFDQCDPDFKDPHNPWYGLASLIRFRCGANMNEWPFKEPAKRDEHLEELKHVLHPDPNDTPLRICKKNAVGGELLAKMLSGTKPPKFLRP